MKQVRERQIPYDIIYMWNLKYDTDELIYKIENRLTVIENKLLVTKGKGGGKDKLGVWDQQKQAVTYRMDKPKGLTV